MLHLNIGLFLALMCFTVSQAKSIGKEISEKNVTKQSVRLDAGERLSTKAQFSIFFSPATDIVPRAWRQEETLRRKRKSYQVIKVIFNITYVLA